MIYQIVLLQLLLHVQYKTVMRANERLVLIAYAQKPHFKFNADICKWLELQILYKSP